MKTRKRFFSMMLTICMLFAMMLPTQVFAAESKSSDNVQITQLEEESQYYDDALRVLNITEEEAQDCTLYAVEPRGISVPNNTKYWFEWFSFSDTNGGAYWTNNGTQLKWGYEWYGTYTNEYDLRLGVYLYAYPGNASNLVDQMWAQNGESRESNWISVVRGLDYRFMYYCNYLTQSGTGYATVHMYVATRN